MEISQPEVEALFVEFLESDVLKEVGNLVEDRPGMPLEPLISGTMVLKTGATSMKKN